MDFLGNLIKLPLQIISEPLLLLTGSGGSGSNTSNNNTTTQQPLQTITLTNQVHYGSGGSVTPAN